MRLVKFTSVPNPDIDGGKSSPILVDAERVVYVERSTVTIVKQDTHEKYRQLLAAMYDELERVNGVVKAITLIPENMNIENEAAHRKWHTISEAANDLKVAYSMLNGIKESWTHPGRVCTTIGLAYGNDSGTGALARLHVTETVEEVHNKLGHYLPNNPTVGYPSSRQ